MSIGVTYAYTVVVTSTDLRTDSQTVTVTPTTTGSAQVSITSTFTSFNPSKKLSLNCDITSFGVLRGTWTVLTVLGESINITALSAPTKLFTSTSNTILFPLSLSAGSLVGGQTYVFRLTATGTGTTVGSGSGSGTGSGTGSGISIGTGSGTKSVSGTTTAKGLLSTVGNTQSLSQYQLHTHRQLQSSSSSYTEITLTANAPPTSGYLLSEPQVGNALTTIFLVSSPGWATDISNYPLSYTFSYKLSSLSSLLTITTASVRAFTTTTLPPGLLKEKYNITLSAQVSDIYFSSGTAVTYVQVKLASGTNVAGFMKSNLLTAFNTGNVDLAFQTVNNVSSYYAVLTMILF